ncbi:MAG: hypothetical protein WC539_09010 [Nitrospirota bacterium]
MKKHLAGIVSIALLFLVSGQAQAASFTQNEFTTAQSLDPGMTQVGVFVSLSNQYNTMYPSLRYGLGGLFEFGAKVGAITNIDDGDSNGVLLGADLKYQLIRHTQDIPVDMALDVGFDTSIISGENVSEVKFSTLFSRDFTLTDRGYRITPYAGLQVSALYGSYIPKDQTNFYVLAGLEWKITQKFLALAELKTGNVTIGGVGIRFEF